MLPNIARSPLWPRAMPNRSDASVKDPKIREAMTEGAKEADEELVAPLFQFRNYGQQLPHDDDPLVIQVRATSVPVLPRIAPKGNV